MPFNYPDPSTVFQDDDSGFFRPVCSSFWSSSMTSMRVASSRVGRTAPSLRSSGLSHSLTSAQRQTRDRPAHPSGAGNVRLPFRSPFTHCRTFFLLWPIRLGDIRNADEFGGLRRQLSARVAAVGAE